MQVRRSKYSLLLLLCQWPQCVIQIIFVFCCNSASVILNKATCLTTAHTLLSVLLERTDVAYEYICQSVACYTNIPLALSQKLVVMLHCLLVLSVCSVEKVLALQVSHPFCIVRQFVLTSDVFLFMILFRNTGSHWIFQILLLGVGWGCIMISM